MRKNLVPLLGIAFVVAIVSTGIFYGLIVGKLRTSSGAQPMTSIVMAAKSLDRGATIKKSDVRLSPWAGSELPKGAFTSVDQVAGLTLVTSTEQNEPVTQARILSLEAGGAPGVVPSGMRAVSVRVFESSGLVSLLKAGSRVDVQAVRNGPRGGVAELQTILQNVEVLSGAHLESGSSNAPVVTMLVKPAEADVLALADEGARIRIALRNPLDEHQEWLPSITMANMFSRRSKLRENAAKPLERSGQTVSLRKAP